MKHFDDDYASILMRTGRLSKSAWAEDPPSRCRRFVTNVRMAESDTAGDYEVVSYLYVERSRGDNWRNETITAERRDVWRAIEGRRSEEHTSELQSLMRISYAVFCLKKKKHKTNIKQIRVLNSK